MGTINVGSIGVGVSTAGLGAKNPNILLKNEGFLAAFNPVGVGVKVKVIVGRFTVIVGFTDIRIRPIAKITNTIKNTNPIKKAKTDLRSDMTYSIT